MVGALACLRKSQFHLLPKEMSTKVECFFRSEALHKRLLFNPGDPIRRLQGRRASMQELITLPKVHADNAPKQKE